MHARWRHTLRCVAQKFTKQAVCRTRITVVLQAFITVAELLERVTGVDFTM